jgi:hypothetical protein
MVCLKGLCIRHGIYDTEPIRSGLESMGVESNIPVNPRNGRRPRP